MQRFWQTMVVTIAWWARDLESHLFAFRNIILLIRHLYWCPLAIQFSHNKKCYIMPRKHKKSMFGFLQNKIPCLSFGLLICGRLVHTLIVLSFKLSSDKGYYQLLIYLTLCNPIDSRLFKVRKPRSHYGSSFGTDNYAKIYSFTCIKVPGLTPGISVSHI